MFMDLANAGLINLNQNSRLRIVTDQDQNNQTVPEISAQVTEPVQIHEEHDQTVPETHSANTRSSKKKRKTKKKNFGNKAKKRNQRNYRKFPAIRVEQQPQEDEIDFPLFDRDPAEPVDDPLPLKGKKIFKNF